MNAVCSLAAKLLNTGLVIRNVEDLYLPMKSEGTEQTKPLLGVLKLCFFVSLFSLCAFTVMKFVGFGGREEGLNSVLQIPVLPPGLQW